MMDILHISQSTENRNLSMNLKFVTTYLKFYTKRSVHFINHVNVKCETIKKSLENIGPQGLLIPVVLGIKKEAFSFK